MSMVLHLRAYQGNVGQQISHAVYGFAAMMAALKDEKFTPVLAQVLSIFTC